MMFSQPAGSALDQLHAWGKRLVDELNRFHPTISRLPVFANDAAAADGKVNVGDPYVDESGFVRRRMS